MKQKMTGIIIITVAIILAIGIIAFAFNYDKILGKNNTKTPTPAATNTPSSETTPVPTEDSELTATPTVIATPIPTVTLSPTPAPVAERVKVKGLYLAPGVAGTPQKVNEFVELANETEINAYIIDIKYDDGKICYETNVPLAKETGAWQICYDPNYVIDKFHDNNIRVIGRLVCFSDIFMATHDPDIAIKGHDGEVYKIETPSSDLAWLDPTNKGTWDYIIDIAREAISLGFDEIQFDYVRFPETTIYDYYMPELDKERHEYIDEFLAYAKQQLPGTVLSADVFGILALQNQPLGGKGQFLETIVQNTDYISPMIYPSHFANDHPNHYMGNKVGTNINGILFKKPDLEPYKVVYNILKIVKSRMDKIEGENVAGVRPYLQGFTQKHLPEGYYKEYTAEDYKAQIQAVYDAGFDEWIFWNPAGVYFESAFK